MTNHAEDPPRASDLLLERSLEAIRQALTGLRFGTVTITVHEGRVVQIDVTEKHRLDR